MICSVLSIITVSEDYGVWELGEIGISRHRYGLLAQTSQSNIKKEDCIPGIALHWNLLIQRPTRLFLVTPGLTQQLMTLSGSTITSSILKLFENTFLAFEYLAFRAAPGIWYLLPRSSGRHPVLGIALCRIIYPVTFKTDPPCILVISRHCSFPLLFAGKTYQTGFSCLHMNSFVRAKP